MSELLRNRIRSKLGEIIRLVYHMPERLNYVIWRVI